MANKYAYAVITGTRSKPNGRAGMVQTRAEANAARKAERQTTFIFREMVPLHFWASLARGKVTP